MQSERARELEGQDEEQSRVEEVPAEPRSVIADGKLKSSSSAGGWLLQGWPSLRCVAGAPLKLVGQLRSMQSTKHATGRVQELARVLLEVQDMDVK